MSAQGRGTVREQQDFYPTPEYCIDLILGKINLGKIGTSREPCRGNKIIYDKLPGYFVDWAELSEGKDYLAQTLGPCDLIVTNPPFSKALEFLEKSLLEAATVCYLLRLNFLGSAKRRSFWGRNRPTHLYVLSKRPSFTGQGTDATEYAWFVFDKANNMIDPPGVYVV